jgi:hypothetical protein
MIHQHPRAHCNIIIPAGEEGRGGKGRGGRKEGGSFNISSRVISLIPMEGNDGKKRLGEVLWWCWW